LRRLEGHSSDPVLLRFSPDGQRLLSVDLDGRLLLWDVSTGKRLAGQDEHTGPLGGLLFGSDGNLRAWEANTAWIIRPQDASLVSSTTVQNGKIFAASPDGLHLVSYAPYHISLWNAQSGELEQTLSDEPDELFDWRFSDTRKDFTSAAYSPDGSRLVVSGTGGSRIYDSAGSLIAKASTGYPHPKKVVFSLDNRHLVGCSVRYCNPEINLIGSETYGIGFKSGPAYATDFAFTPAGDLVGGVMTGGENQPGEFILWQADNGEQVKSLPIPDAHLTSLAFSADGRLAAIGQAGGKIILLDTNSLKVLVTLSGHNDSIQYLAFSKTGEFLASASADGTIRFWSLP
jgi:WD40 repeat protein